MKRREELSFGIRPTKKTIEGVSLVVCLSIPWVFGFLEFPRFRKASRFCLYSGAILNGRRVMYSMSNFVAHAVREVCRLEIIKKYY